MKTHASILREIAVANISDYKKGNGAKQSYGDNIETSLQGHFAFIYRIDLLEVRSALRHARKTSIASWLLEMVLHIDKSPANCGKDILLLPRHFDITGVIEVEATFMY